MTKLGLLRKYTKKWKDAEQRSRDVSLHLIHRLRYSDLAQKYLEIVSDIKKLK